MRILIVDQCSKAKDGPDWFTPFDATDIDASSREELLSQENVPSYPACDLYTGRQQRFVSDAIDRLREAGDDVTRLFISAGFGVVDERTELPPYDVTFSNYSADEIDRRSEKLGIKDELLERLAAEEPFDIVFFPLGKDYYRSIDLRTVLATLPGETFGVVFNKESLEDEFENTVSFPARNGEAKELGTIVVAVKGQYLKNFAEHRSVGEDVTDADDIRNYCKRGYTSQSDLDQFDKD